MNRWRNGDFVGLYLGGLGLSLNELSLVNIAWCATKGDYHPARMLETCFQKHTSALLKLLDPDLVLLSGKADVHPFEGKVRESLPRAMIIKDRHYSYYIRSPKKSAPQLHAVKMKIDEIRRGSI
jgi:hypothetical protein